MGSCSLCDQEIAPSSSFDCSGCGDVYCPEHRKPDRHDCPDSTLRKTRAAAGAATPDLASVLGAPLVALFFVAYAGWWLAGSVASALLTAATLLLDVRVAAVVFVGLPVLLVGIVGAGVIGTGDVAGTPAEPVVSGADSVASEIDDVLGNAANSGQREFNHTKAEQMILERTNEIREERGLPPLEWNDRAAGVARTHAEDMAANGYFSHTNSQGQGQQERYAFCRGGENIAQTYFDETFRSLDGETRTHTDADDVATGVVRQWTNSDSHREDGLLGPWRAAGVGIAVDGDEVYVVMGFC